MVATKFWSLFRRHRRLGYFSYGSADTGYTLYRHDDGYSIHHGDKYIAGFTSWREAKAAFYEMVDR